MCLRLSKSDWAAMTSELIDRAYGAPIGAPLPFPDPAPVEARFFYPAEEGRDCGQPWADHCMV